MTQKRWRTPEAKSGELKVAYGKEKHDNPDLYYCYRGEAGMSRDSRLLSIAFERTDIIGDGSLVKELEQRGYDITTLKFSIMKKQCK